MNFRDLTAEEYPALLREIPEPPKRLRLWGTPPKPGNKLLCIVGSRKYSHYGKEACESIIAGLSGYPITIISGLALGIDSIAHRAAMRNGLQTVALPGSGLSPKVLHPRSHVPLAEEIVASGGGLMSEFEDEFPAEIWTFVRRNRIMAGMCEATLIIEADMKSGTLVTSRLATDYNREVGAVPGPTTSPTSDGPHMLIRLGAALVRNAEDVLEILGLKSGETNSLFSTEDITDEEKIFMNILKEPLERNALIRKSKLDISKANAILSLLEIKGLIKEELGEVRKTF